jgi:hypothetical protein
MVLVPVVTIVGEDNIRVEFGFNFFKPVFDARPLTRKIAFPKRSDSDFLIFHSGKKVVCLGGLLVTDRLNTALVIPEIAACSRSTYHQKS